MTTTTTPRPSTGWTARFCGTERSIPAAMAATVPAATGASMAIWAISRLGDVELAVRSGGDTRTITWTAVLVMSAIFAAVGTATLAFLERRFSRGRRIGVALATVVFLLSLVMGPLAATTVSGAVVLGAMHAAVYGSVVGAFRRGC